MKTLGTLFPHPCNPCQYFASQSRLRRPDFFPVPIEKGLTPNFISAAHACGWDIKRNESICIYDINFPLRICAAAKRVKGRSPLRRFGGRASKVFTERIRHGWDTLSLRDAHRQSGRYYAAHAEAAGKRGRYRCGGYAQYAEAIEPLRN